MKSGKSKVQNRGRKTTFTNEATSLFLAAIENGMSVKQACIQAKVSKSAYDRHRAKSEEFRREIEVSKEKLIILAKSKLVGLIQKEDGATIRWFLERQCPAEYGRQCVEEYDPFNGRNVTVVLPGSKPHPRINLDVDE